MRITTLVENTSRQNLPFEHGLSLHIQLNNGKQILFDMGQRALFADNAKTLHIDLEKVDMAVVSHGHYDHGGGLHTFLSLNNQADVWLQKSAFEPHYSLRTDGLKAIGLDTDLLPNPRFHWVDKETQPYKDVILFAQVESNVLSPTGNHLLFGPSPTTPDKFEHELSMIIREGNNTILFAGCAHTGILNIMNRAEQLTSTHLTHVIAGMHLVKSGLDSHKKQVFISSLATELKKFKNCQYYTMHCTGLEAYTWLKQDLQNQIHYLSTGDVLNLP